MVEPDATAPPPEVAPEEQPPAAAAATQQEPPAAAEGEGDHKRTPSGPAWKATAQVDLSHNASHPTSLSLSLRVLYLGFNVSADAQVNQRCFASTDLGVTADLKPHQLDGVAWLIRRYHLGVNVVLGDEMGLSKTLQAISLLSYLKIQSNAPAGPFLVLCPLSVTGGWFSEFGKFCPTLTVIQYVGDKAHRRDLRRMMYEHVQKSSASSDSNELPFDVMVTTYDIALMDQDFLSQIPWHYAVIDEAQRLKNPSSGGNCSNALLSQ